MPNNIEPLEREPSAPPRPGGVALPAILRRPADGDLLIGSDNGIFYSIGSAG